MYKNSEEKRLFKACQKGSREAQFSLYNKYKVYLFAICMRYAKGRSEAEDILQEAFYKIFRDSKQFKEQSPLKSWMAKITVNSALMHIRKYKKWKLTEIDEQAYETMGYADTSLMESDRAQAIMLLIRKLPSIQQTIFNLRGIDGYSFTDIAAMTQIKEATLRSHYLRARKSLQDLLQKELN